MASEILSCEIKSGFSRTQGDSIFSFKTRRLSKLEEAGLELMEYDKWWGAYRVRLAKGEIEGHAELLRSLLQAAYEWRWG